MFPNFCVLFDCLDFVLIFCQLCIFRDSDVVRRWRIKAGQQMKIPLPSYIRRPTLARAVSYKLLVWHFWISVFHYNLIKAARVLLFTPFLLCYQENGQASVDSTVTYNSVVCLQQSGEQGETAANHWREGKSQVLTPVLCWFPPIAHSHLM